VREVRADRRAEGYRFVEKTGDELVLERRWREGPARLVPSRKFFTKTYFFWFFGLFWVGHQAIWWTLVPANDFFAIPHLIVAALLVYVMTARLVAKTRIEVRGGRMHVAHSMPWPGKRDVAIDHALPLRVESQEMPRQRGAVVQTWNLVSREGEVLVDGLESQADALGAHIEQQVAPPAPLADDSGPGKARAG